MCVGVSLSALGDREVECVVSSCLAGFLVICFLEVDFYATAVVFHVDDPGEEARDGFDELWVASEANGGDVRWERTPCEVVWLFEDRAPEFGAGWAVTFGEPSDSVCFLDVATLGRRKVF